MKSKTWGRRKRKPFYYLTRNITAMVWRIVNLERAFIHLWPLTSQTGSLLGFSIYRGVFLTSPSVAREDQLVFRSKDKLPFPPTTLPPSQTAPLLHASTTAVPHHGAWNPPHRCRYIRSVALFPHGYVKCFSHSNLLNAFEVTTWSQPLLEVVYNSAKLDFSWRWKKNVVII